MQIKARGATPIEKNVIVVDEQGNEYEATYPKRAKGLVKNGRARFVSENKICLACPPNENLEDNKMSEDTNVKNVEATECTKFTIEYILEQLEKVREDSAYIFEALSKLECVTTGGSGDIGAAEKAKGIADVVRCRETTNQQLLRFYEKLYDDIKAEAARTNDQAEKIGLIKSAFDQNMAFINEGGLDADDQCAALTYVTDKIAELVKTVIVRSADESEEQKNKRREFLDFVSTTTVTANGAATEGTVASLPDFDNIWKTVFLGS